MSRGKTPVNPRAVRADSGPFALVLLGLCFALSGLAALVYQTAWMRQFALVFGTSELAVATVLAAYMGGLALGAWLAERFLPRVTRPVLTYAVLEFGIGIAAAVLVPLLLAGSSALLVALFGAQPAPPSSEQVGTSLFYLGSAFVALAIPTTLMGATLPLLARYAVHTDAQVGRRIGLLYAINTAGAVGGALLTAFVLLPSLGLRATIWVAAGINVAVFVLAALLAQRQRDDQPVSPLQRLTGTWRPPAPAWVLPLMLLSGAVAFMHEVLWTRMLSHVVGSSIYAFGVMVASFLAGIAIGGAVAAWFARDRRSAVVGLAACQVGVALTGATSFLFLEVLIPERTGLAANAFMGAAVLLPLTLFIGGTFPFAVRILADDAGQAAAASARVYAWNTVGAIVGALGAGFVLIPALRYEGAIRFAVALSGLLAIAALWLIAPTRRLWAGAATAAIVAAVVAFRPASPQKLLLTSPLNVPNHGTVLHYSIGRSASVVLLEQDGTLALRTNGLPEALMDTVGSTPRFSGEYWLSPLAVIARPATERMLIVGYGGGVVVEGVPPSVRHIDVIELEPQVIEANEATRALRRRDPLSDPRLNLITNDARGALRLTARRYEAIVSQPSHPWTAGASHLYTREFMALARSRLADGGVFVQWMNVGFLDEPLLRSLTATLLSVFREVRLYRPDPSTLVFLASDAPLDLEHRVATDGMPLTLSPGHYARFGINAAEDLVAALAVDGPGAVRLAAGAPLITDDSNRMATSSVFELGRGLTPDAAGRALAAYDPLQDPGSALHRTLAPRLVIPYVARRCAAYSLIDPSIQDRLRRLGDILGRTANGAYVRGMALSAAGRRDEAKRFFREASVLHPDDMALRWEAVRPLFGAIVRGEADSATIAELERLPDVARAVFEGIRAAGQNQWDLLPTIDPRLAQAAWTDAWAFDAMQLRADWRSRVANEDVKRRLGDEALALIDRMIVVQPTTTLYGLRARSALAAGRPDILVESIWSFAAGVYGGAARMAPEERSGARATLDGLITLLDQTASQGVVNARRVEEVRQRVREASARLG